MNEGEELEARRPTSVSLAPCGPGHAGLDGGDH